MTARLWSGSISDRAIIHRRRNRWPAGSLAWYSGSRPSEKFGHTLDQWLGDQVGPLHLGSFREHGSIFHGQVHQVHSKMIGYLAIIRDCQNQQVRAFAGFERAGTGGLAQRVGGIDGGCG